MDRSTNGSCWKSLLANIIHFLLLVLLTFLCLVVENILKKHCVNECIIIISDEYNNIYTYAYMYIHTYIHTYIHAEPGHW